MRKILTLLLVVISLNSFSQTQPSGIPSPRSDSGFAQYNWVRALKGGFIFPSRDTSFSPTYIGSVIYWANPAGDSSLWILRSFTGQRWARVVTLSGGVSSGTVTSIATNSATGITGGTITTSGTLALDTTLVSTRLWRQKGIDSVQYNLTSGLSLKVNISDTASMLSAYLRKTDTSAMLSNYVPISRTITTNVPLLGGGNLSANRTLSADTGRNAAQLVTGGSLRAVKDSLVALIASSGGGTVLSVATTNGVGIISSVATPSSTPNISIRADTLSLSTRWWRQKGIDSVQTNLTNGLALKLNLSDTAAMLSNRLKISDTAFMLMPFMQYSDTSFMLSPYRRTSTKITNSDLVNSTISGISLGSNLAALTFGQYLQVGASSYNGSTATTITTNATSTNSGSTLVARDINGDFSARNISAALLGNASSASTVAITNDITTNATYYPMFTTVTTGSGSSYVSSSKLTYNPSTGMLSSTGFTGNLTGNASSATVLQTPRTINGVAFDGSANITISAAVGNSLTAGYGITGSPFDGSLARTWVIDTSNISTKANVTGALVAKLNISDTTAMLSGYKTYYPRTAISAGTGITYNPATGVITNSSPSSGGTVTSIATNNGSGITGGTITSTGTIAADTTILSTKANVTGILVGYTTLAQNALKVNISDTASMLSNYRRKTTLIENADLRNSAITINGSSTSLGGSISVGTVTSVATGVGLSGGTITTSGTISADTTTLSTRAYVTGQLVGYATTGNLALKLNISDTATMLSNYRRSTTLIQNSDLANSTISGVFLGNNLSSHVAGNGLSGTNYNGNGGVTWNVDTSIISTKANVTALLLGYATNANVAAKLNISDTATMLSNYRRKTTLIENTDLRNSAITINGSSTALGGSISVGTVTSVAASAGTGISVSGSPITGSGTLTITNTAPDQTVTLTAGSGISVSGTYPNFTITNSSPSSGGTVTSVSAGIGMSFTTITSTGAVNADTTVLATRAYAAGLDVAKANTSLNNVNGVLSSTYGGAGSVSGILKANGSGVVSAAVAGTDYVSPSSLSGYVDLTTNQTVAGIKTFSSRIISTGGSLRAYTNGSNTQGAGANLMLSNAAETNFWFQQLNASNNIDWHYFNGTSYSNPMYLTTAGNFGVSGTIAAAGATLSGALSGTSLSMSGGGSFGSTVGIYGSAPGVPQIRMFLSGTDGIFGVTRNSGTAPNLIFQTEGTERARLASDGTFLINTTTTDGTNKLIVNGGVKGGAFTGTTATFLSGSSTTEALIIGGAGGAGSTRQGQLKFGDAGTIYKIQGGEDYSAFNFIIGSTTVQSLASNGAATFSSSVTATEGLFGGAVTNGTDKLRVSGNTSTSQLITGSFNPNMTLRNTATTLSSLYTTLIAQGGSSYTYTLDAASGHNRIYIIRAYGSGTSITLNRSGSDVIVDNAGNNQTSLTITPSGGAVWVQSNGSDAYIQLK